MVFTVAKWAVGTASIGSAVNRSRWAITNASSSGSSGMDAMLPGVDCPPAIVTAYRGGLAESTHQVHVAVADARGRLVAWAGDPQRLTVLRSAAKPWQAGPLVDTGALDAFGLDDRVLAVACASHLGQDMHVREVERGLAAAGLDACALRNTAGPPVERLAHNCSGNHLGFLLASVHSGWPLDDYRAPGHPSQRAALAKIAEAAELPADRVSTCTDGCGVLAFALPLATIAAMYARMPQGLPRQRGAMRAHPELVRGDGGPDTEFMRHIPGCVSKSGAEGLQGVGLADHGLGVAVRAEDGAGRAVAPVLVAALGALLGWSEPPQGLAEFVAPGVRNSPGDVVGRLEASVRLHTSARASL
jgi:L-asparaginase